jgi:hypothetical protein
MLRPRAARCELKVDGRRLKVEIARPRARGCFFQPATGNDPAARAKNFLLSRARKIIDVIFLRP